MATFETDIKIGFHHCDPAGIVFYPRYFEMFNTVVEEWFEQRVTFSFHTIHMERNEVVPTVHADADFVAPSRLGELLTFSLQLKNIGTSSIDLTIDVHCETEARAQVNLVLVYAKSGVSTSEGWPEDLRTALSQQLVTM